MMYGYTPGPKLQRHWSELALLREGEGESVGVQNRVNPILGNAIVVDAVGGVGQRENVLDFLGIHWLVLGLGEG